MQLKRWHPFSFEVWVLLLMLSLLSGCTAYSKSAFPAAALAKVDQTVSFPKLQEHPESFQGTIVMIGGEVLSAKRLHDRTELTILQLPLNDYNEPITDRTQSQGRFQAIKKEFLDPAIVPPGTRITIIGEVSGTATEMLDEMKYTYPVITINHFRVWPDVVRLPDYRYYPYWYGPFHPYSYRRGFYGPFYGPYPYYWW